LLRSAISSLLEQLVLRLHALHLLLNLLLLLLLLGLALNHLAVLAQEPLLSRNFHLQLLLHLLLIAAVPQIEVFFPGQEVFGGDGGKCCEFGSLENFNFFCDDFFLLFVSLSFDEVLVDPVPGLFHYVKNDGFLLTVDDDIIDLFGDRVDIVAGDAGNRLQFVLDGREGVLLGVLEHETDLVLELVAAVGLAQDGELEGGGFL
jgi:hypothetical protein